VLIRVVKIKYAFMAASYKKKNAMLVFLFLIIGIGLLSISVQTIMTNANAQRSSDSTSDGTIGSDTRVTQIGICVIGVASHCNGIK
jgi:hypothetical protein